MTKPVRTGKAIALQRFATGCNTQQIADELGIDRTTVWRWRSEPEFAEQLRALQQQILSDVHDSLVASALKSIQALESIRDDTEALDLARVRAAQLLLELLGLHKAAPAKPQTTEGEIETEEQLEEALEQLPTAILRRTLEKRERATAEKAASRKKRAPKQKDL